MSEILDIFKSKQNIYSLSLAHVVYDNIDEIIINIETIDHEHEQGSLHETDFFSNEEKNAFQELFLQNSGRVSLRDISGYAFALGQFMFARENLADLRVIYLGHDQRAIDSWMLNAHYFEEIQNGWYIMVIVSRGN
jgi:hypothetical protein